MSKDSLKLAYEEIDDAFAVYPDIADPTNRLIVLYKEALCAKFLPKGHLLDIYLHLVSALLDEQVSDLAKDSILSLNRFYRVYFIIRPITKLNPRDPVFNNIKAIIVHLLPKEVFILASEKFKSDRVEFLVSSLKEYNIYPNNYELYEFLVEGVNSISNMIEEDIIEQKNKKQSICE